MGCGRFCLYVKVVKEFGNVFWRLLDDGEKVLGKYRIFKCVFNVC